MLAALGGLAARYLPALIGYGAKKLSGMGTIGSIAAKGLQSSPAKMLVNSAKSFLTKDVG
jgi:hypothetical protein